MEKYKVRNNIIFVLAFVLVFNLFVVTNGSVESFAQTSKTYKNAKGITYTLTGNQAKDIVGIAKTQIGQGEYERYYSSKKQRDIVRTVYGDYFGYDYEWCAVFVCWCARKAGIDKNIIPYSTFADPNKFKGKYYKRGKVTPKTGDIIFFGNKTHVGLVTSSKDGYVYTIEGNTACKQDNGYVATHKFRLSDSWIMGYVRPSYKTKATTYTATFATGTNDNVTNMPATQKVTAGNTLYLKNLSIPKRNGYTFAGWKNSNDGKIYKSSLKIGGNRTFTAQWTKNANSSSSSGTWVQTGTSYSKWSVSKPAASTITSGTIKKVTTVESVNAYTSYAYFTSNKQKCWKATNDGYYTKLLKIYSSVNVASSGYKKDTDGSYFLPRTVSISSPGKLGTVYRLSYGGEYASSFTAGLNLGYTFVWPTSSKIQTIYRTKTVTYSYK